MGKIDEKQTRTILLVLVVLVVFVAFRFGYVPINEKAEAVAAENAELSAKISSLENIKANAEAYQTELNTANEGIEKIKNNFAADITPQQSIMMVRKLEQKAEVTVSNISFNEKENVYVSSYVNENGENVLADRSMLNISFDTTYDGLKKTMDFINTYEDRMNVESFSAAYNQETGKLIGTMNINIYSIVGLGKQYKEPAVDGIAISRDNIFGTIK